MSAFSRFLNNLFAPPETAVRLAWKRERAISRLMRRKLHEAEEKLYWKGQEVAERDKRVLQLETDLGVVRQDLAQRLAASECLESQVELQTVIIAKYILKEESEAAVFATRKALAVDRGLKRQEE